MKLLHRCVGVDRRRRRSHFGRRTHRTEPTHVHHSIDAASTNRRKKKRRCRRHRTKISITSTTLSVSRGDTRLYPKTTEGAGTRRWDTQTAPGTEPTTNCRSLHPSIYRGVLASAARIVAVEHEIRRIDRKRCTHTAQTLGEACHVQRLSGFAATVGSSINTQNAGVMLARQSRKEEINQTKTVRGRNVHFRVPHHSDESTGPPGSQCWWRIRCGIFALTSKPTEWVSYLWKQNR
jgi:hypothetical protein